MGNGNLTNLKDRSPEERKAIATKGGKVKSARKSLAAKVRGLKMCKSDKLKKFIAMIEDPRIAQIELLEIFESVHKDIDDMEDKDRIALVNAGTKVHGQVFGAKIKQMSLNVNVDSDAAEQLVDNWFNEGDEE